MLSPGRIGMKTSICHQQHAKRSGAALVEFAFVLPVFLAIVLGIVEFGRAFVVHEMLTNATRTGSRSAVLSYITSNQAIISEVKSTLTEGKLPVADVTVSILVNGSAGNLSNANRGDQIMVRATVPYSKVAFITPTFLANHNVVSETVMRRE